MTEHEDVRCRLEPIHDRFGYALGGEGRAERCARCATELGRPGERIYRWRSRSDPEDDWTVILVCDPCDAALRPPGFG